MGKVGVVFRKELIDISRDRRAVMTAFAYALFGPLLLSVVLSFASRAEGDAQVRLAVAGAERAPFLVRHLENAGVSVQPANTSNDFAIPEGADALLEVPLGFEMEFASGEPALLRLYADHSNRRQAFAAARVEAAVQNFSQYAATARLMVRGVPSQVITPVRLASFDRSSSSVQSRVYAGMLLIFFVMAPFFGGMSGAIDTTAGERERNTLQSLLVHPVEANSIMLGKWGAVAVLAMLGTCVTVAVGALALRFVPLGALGVRLHLDALTATFVTLSLLPLAVLVSAVQMWLAISARSYKEGQTYLTLLSFVPVLVGFVYSFSPGAPKGWQGFIPMLSEMRLLDRLFREGSPSFELAAPTFLASIALAVVFVILTARRLGSERVLDQQS